MHIVYSSFPSNNKYEFSGKGQFGGRLGKVLMSDDVYKRKVVKFNPISCADFPRLPTKVIQQLSQDNRMLYRLCLACLDGTCQLKV